MLRSKRTMNGYVKNACWKPGSTIPEYLPPHFFRTPLLEDIYGDTGTIYTNVCSYNTYTSRNFPSPPPIKNTLVYNNNTNIKSKTPPLPPARVRQSRTEFTDERF